VTPWPGIGAAQNEGGWITKGLPETGSPDECENWNDSNLIAATEQHWIIDWVAITIQELQTDKRIAPNATADGLLGESNGGAFQHYCDIPAGFRSVRAFHVVTKDETSMKPAQRDIPTQGDERTARILTATSLDCTTRHGLAQQVCRNSLPLHTSAQVKLLAEIATVTVMELKVNVWIASDATAHRLLGYFDRAAFRQQGDIELAEDSGGVGAFRIVTKDDACIQPAKAELASKRDRGTAGILTAGGIHCCIDPHRMIEACRNLFVRKGGRCA